jgi:hypothetical protein
LAVPHDSSNMAAKNTINNKPAILVRYFTSTKRKIND